MRSIFYSSLFAIVLSSVTAIDYLEVDIPSKRSYLVATEICCNGTIYENKNSFEYECCGGKLIEKKKEICCFPESYPSEPNVECCGNKSYNTQTHACHAATQGRTRTYSWEGFEQFLILPLDVNETTMCGDKIVNLEEEICCGYRIIPDPDQKLDCCGHTNQTYDPSSQICCRGSNPTKIIAKSGSNDADCCGEKSYNDITQFCSREHIIVDSPKGDFSICNDTIFDMTKEVCCMDFDPHKVLTKLAPNHDACCGHITYNDTDSVCCTSWRQQGATKCKLHPRVENRDCCGSEMLDYNQRCCCDDRPYDPQIQTCCSSLNPSGNAINIKVFEVPNGRCCGSEIMDLEKEDCCGISVIPKSPDDKSGCCMHTVNDVESYQSRRLSPRHRFFSDNSENNN